MSANKVVEKYKALCEKERAKKSGKRFTGMNRVKWNGVDSVPENGTYLTQLKNGRMVSMPYCDGWNCRVDWELGELNRSFERDDVVAWAELPERWRKDG